MEIPILGKDFIFTHGPAIYTSGYIHQIWRNICKIYEENAQSGDSSGAHFSHT